MQQNRRFPFAARVVCRFAALVALAAAPTGPTEVAAEELSTGSPETARDAHPLAYPLQLVTERYDHIRENIRDYECWLVKRERIDGRLQEPRYIFVQARQAVVRDGRVVQPLAVFLQYQRPEKLKGRRVLFVEGENENRMFVRRGGDRFASVTVNVAVDSDLARRESLLPITETGFDEMAASLIRRIRSDTQADPRGENTQVRYYRKAKVDERNCTRIEVVHPEPAPELTFHAANIFLDDEWGLPVRLETYDWPETEDDKPPLTGEFTYLKLRLNVGLTDGDFRRSRVTAKEQ